MYTGFFKIHRNKSKLFRAALDFFVCLLLLKMKNFISKLRWEIEKSKNNMQKERRKPPISPPRGVAADEAIGYIYFQDFFSCVITYA